MSLNTIKNKLEKIGYKVFFKDNHIWGGVESEETLTENSEFQIIKKGFQIYEEKKSFKLVLMNAIIGNEYYFESTEQLIEIVTKELPVE